MLTESVDNLTGTAGNDTVTAVLDQHSATWTALDVINGGAGSDTMNVLDVTGGLAGPAGTQVTSIETINVRSAGDVGAGQGGAFDVSGFTGVNNLNVTQGNNVYVMAGGTTAVSVAGADGSVTVGGGSTVAVTSAVVNNEITVGADGSSTGAVSVTHTELAGGSIMVNGGTAVTISASGIDDHGQQNGGIKVGNAAAPTGAVSITAASAATNGDASFGMLSLGGIEVTGGSSVTVTQSVTAGTGVATKADTANVLAQADITINGDSKTTSVTVTQAADAAGKTAVAAVAGVKQVDTVTFIALASGESVEVGGLTFTAAKSLTAAQVSAAFANLSAGATGGSAAASSGLYSGVFGDYTTGTVTTANSVSTVTATAVTAATGSNPILVQDQSKNNITSANTTKGVTAVDAVTGQLKIAAGTVKIDGTITGTDVLATVSLDGYGAGSTIESDALTTLTLANSVNDLTVTNAKATTLALNVNNIVQDAVALDLDNGGNNKTYTTLNITTSGKDSTVNLTADKVATLTVAGDKALDLSVATLGALKTVTVSGAAGLTLDASGANVTAVSTAATTGNSTLTVDADKATFTGGNGKDTVTLSATTVDKAVSLGGGDDSLTLAAGTTAISTTVDGGNGTDTLAMDAADAAALSTADVSDELAGFEKLSLGQAATAVSIDLANLDGINYVISAGGAAGSAGNRETFILSAPGFTEIGNDTTVTFDGYTYTYIASSYSPYGSAFFFAGNYNTNAISPSYALIGTANNSMIFEATSDGNKTDVTSADFVVNAGTTDTGILSFTVSGVTDGTAASAGGELTLTKMANAGTLELTGAATSTTVTMTDATGTADSFNIITKVSTADLDFGTVDVQDVETVNITATDTNTKAAINLATLELVGDAKTVVVTGNGDITLTSAITALKTVDASALTGDFTFSSAVNSATVTGGAGDDLITGTGNSQILTGGLGDDTLVVQGNLARLTGGVGKDVFDVGAATSTVNSYATITDLAAGDAIKLSAAALEFASSAVALADTASFQDYANAAIAATDDGEVSWFQFAGNTYVVENVAIQNSNAPEVTFTNGQDIVVRITGLVDLSTSGFNTTQNALLVV